MVEIRYEEENNRAAAYDGDKEVGECTYSPNEKFWIIDHTGVDSEYGGQGIAKKLVVELVKQARDKDLKIMPLCPFALSEFQKNEEYSDIWMK